MNNDKATRTPQQARSMEKRRRLMDAAMRLFDTHGFDGTNAKAIARDAGVSVGTFYAYFKDKKDLLMEILGEHTAEIDTIFGKLEAAVRDGATGREILRLAVAAGHASHTQPPGLLRTMLAMRYTDDDMRRFQEAEETAHLKRMVGFLETLGPRLRVSDLEAAASVFGSAFEDILHSAIVFSQDIDRQRLHDALVDMGAAYLFTDPDARG
ncbi:MAG: TetR/AcrR family transcriptional regulator [Pseudodesulfovibrio sp.]|uniref:Regulatory protein TetR n=1 Tax=Pseudodesulfovibrio aespoeensis (strain ATCC 700646 / DSM 10631 / Aspo-2) TaxID=643562 RepID=E6VXJ5_PSEA9|nr:MULTISPECIES: TetR/AcrR family transcriptional regulator [Pseudodesulfovibrio]MBU4193038.1 TetR/AcrR family transcriptional regulator [Pseudomonadota bacterium]ADU63811.1 regulatory protein TetR [Pseudodesulfovibrio aespoeensis Aspo-2]MBU4242941.1 TetR/AcrR family transcriptional regulator [Pseudomonadota bacterium]MBU4379215.1 TetR/AcrR family transcriptional regulator [Pseudomonadota bacterium]MBU4515033.1 TetR/AcrR family transcriptional regulator [Pseudomonadota bacterium]